MFSMGIECSSKEVDLDIQSMLSTDANSGIRHTCEATLESMGRLASTRWSSFSDMRSSSSETGCGRPAEGLDAKRRILSGVSPG